MPRFFRKALHHTQHFAGRFGATYFITVCTRPRGVNQLCHEQTMWVLFRSARIYHEQARWYLRLLLLMPDHVHALIAVPADGSLSKLLRDYKRITARTSGVKWQRNFFDHRLRQDESLTEKYDYILQNPVRAGLVAHEDKWPYVLTIVDLERDQGRGD